MTLLHGGSLGGCASIVRITEARLSGGRHHQSALSYVSAEIKLEGKLLVFDYGHLKEKLISTNTEVSIEIEFESEFLKNHEIDTSLYDDYGDNSEHIGRIQLFGYSEDVEVHGDLSVYISITLPHAMFHYLYSMEGKSIRFETIHNLVEQPTEDQKLDHVVALVRRVHFITESPLPHPKWPFERWRR